MLKDTKKEKQEELLNKEVSFFVLIINYKEVFKEVSRSFKEVFIKKF